MDELTPQDEHETQREVVAFSAKQVGKDESFTQAGKPARFPFGVGYMAEYETEWDGTAVAARLHARALEIAGFPVLLRSFSHKYMDQFGVLQDASQGLPEEVEKEVGHLRSTSIAAQVPVIKHIVIRDATHLKTLIWPRGASGGYSAEELIAARDRVFRSTVLFSVWERDRIDPEIADLLKQLAACWVPCNQNANMLRAAGVERVHVVPHPFHSGDPICHLAGRSPDTSGWKRFYSIGRWEPRKGFDQLLEAFLSAFTPEDKALLTLKITGGEWPDFATPRDLVTTLLEREDFRARGWTPETFGARVKVFDGRKPRSEIIGLHYYNNIYVSSSHGEAWNLPAFEAKLAGNVLVHVPFGGTMEFSAPERDQELPWKLGPVHASYGWENDAQWATYLTADLAEALRRVQPPTTYDAAGMERFSLANVSKLMRAAVLEVCDRNYAKAAAFYRADKEAMAALEDTHERDEGSD